MNDANVKLTVCLSFLLQDLEISQYYEIQQGHTYNIEGYLRLYSDIIVPSTTGPEHINTNNNRSLIQFNRKL
jgi:hypothetical protein